MNLANAVPVIGHTFEVNFGKYVFHTTFDSDRQLTFNLLQGDLGVHETVNYQRVEINPNAWLLFWQEKDRSTVTGFWDFAKQVVYSNVTLPDNTFLNLKSSLKRIA